MRNWSEAELQRLIRTGQEENLQLEFKRLTSTEDTAKTEMSKDVSAFANTIGGTIIYGLEEHPDPPHKATRINPIDPRTISKEWLEQVVNSRIQPRIVGVRIHSVDLPSPVPGGVAYVVEIPESSTAHQAYDKKYYRRFNFQSVPMADHEIRQAMNRALKPAYSAWFRSHRFGHPSTRESVIFTATVVNVSEITPTIMSATLYLPAAGLGGEPWQLVSIEGTQYRRFEASIDNQWNPGRQSNLNFSGAELPFHGNVPMVAPLRVHLKLFDNWGLALHERYEVTFPTLTHTVLLSESDRKPAAVIP